jgi:hypothetical protein
MSRIEAYGASRNLIDNAFTHLTWYEDVCEQVGFKGISQIWKEEPAWYFWQKQVKGAFLLRLHADEALVTEHYLSFTLHYFPRPDEAACQQLPDTEKALLADQSLFHPETNTPNFEAYEDFLSTFVVAEIGCVVDAENSLQLLLYSSDCDERHPVYRFLDLLITTLNFQSKRHHQQAYALQDGPLTTLFLSYSEGSFRRFLAFYELEAPLLETVVPNAKQKLWKYAAHLEAVCSAGGACSCSH